MKTIYLSGPITGLSYKGCTSWRQHVAKELASDVVGLSPLRGKDFLAKMTTMPHTLEANVLSSQRGIMTRDRFDTTVCDALFANFLGATTVSIDTCMEIAWADMLRKPIILVMEAEGNLHDHPMIRDAAGYRVTTVEEGVALANALLSLEFDRTHQ